MKNIFPLPQKKISEKRAPFWLNGSELVGRGTLFLLIHSICYNMLFWLTYKKKIWPHTDVAGKGRNTLAAF